MKLHSFKLVWFSLFPIIWESIFSSGIKLAPRITNKNKNKYSDNNLKR